MVYEIDQDKFVYVIKSRAVFIHNNEDDIQYIGDLSEIFYEWCAVERN